MIEGHEQVAEWVRRYEQAWRTAGTDAARELFSEDATYRTAPYDDPLRGFDEIAAMWERERDGPDEQFAMTSEIVAVEGGTAVVRVEVHYREPRTQEYRDLWIIELDRGGRCTAFEEWPFWPERQPTPGTPRPSP